MTKVIGLSIAAALCTTSIYANDIDSELKSLKKQMKKLEKKLKRVTKKLSVVKAHDAGDNIKWDVDFRTAVDRINYTHEDGTESENSSLMTNRLLLGMKYKADDNITFYGTLSYNKAYGDSANHSQANTNPGYANFDWVTNENANDNTIKLKEAYWLYMNDTFLGANMPWTASIGRRPSTGGLGINFREGDNRKSAIASTVNIEFDGASFKWNLDGIGGPEGSWVKLCAGRGVTNAKPRFTMNGTDYSEDTTLHSNSDMIGLIVVPYDNGQYSVHMNYANAKHMIGFTNTEMGKIMGGQAGTFQDVGDFSLMTAMVKAEGVGDEINDFLDNTILFASYSKSVTDPNSSSSAVINPENGMTNGGMLGSTDKESGHSIWIGAQMPCPITDDGRFGIEWNKGSKYWRSMTYGEDTMVGSKIATRGTAIEAYWLKPLTKSLSLNLRYTKIDYDYTGSNAFFGADGTPTAIKDAQQAHEAGLYPFSPVSKAEDIRVSVRYRF